LGGVGFQATLRVGFVRPTPEVQLDHFLHHTPKLGIPAKMVQFFMKLLLKQHFYFIPQFPLCVGCYKILNSQKPRFIHIMLTESESEILERSDIL